jgi:hypothetical protein
MVSPCWLGPFHIAREPRSYLGVRQWMIVNRTGHAVQIHIPYKVDAQAACDVLNRAGGVPSPPRTRRETHP